MKKIATKTFYDTDIMAIDDILKAIDILLFLEGLELEVGSDKKGITLIGLQKIKDKR